MANDCYADDTLSANIHIMPDLHKSLASALFGAEELVPRHSSGQSPFLAVLTARYWH